MNGINRVRDAQIKPREKRVILYSAFLKGYDTGAGPKVTGTKLTEEIGEKNISG